MPLTRAHRHQYDIIHRYHHEIVGEFPELINPRTYNEKIAWLMLFDQQQLTIRCIDKYGVRQFVKDRVGCAYLNELYAIGDTFDDIDFDELPDSFLIKTNHDSGTVVLVSDSANWDRRSSRLRIQAALKKPYGIEKGEWAYQFITRKVIVEKYLGLFEGKPLVDYKFHCVDGKVRWLQ